MKKLFGVVALVSLIVFLSGCDYITPPVEIEYTVSFNSNGGTDVSDIVVGEGKSFLEPVIPTKDGYIFSGWYSDTLLVNYYNFTSGVTGDLRLNAKWESLEYTLTFETNGGDTIAPVTAAFEGTIDDVVPVKEGNTFAGWFSDIELTVAFELPSTMPAEDFTLYAGWEVAQYTVTYLDFDETVIEVYTYDYNQDLTAETAPIDPTNEGMTFFGWDTDLPDIMPLGDLVITALYDFNQYTISFVGPEGDILTPETYDYLNVIDLEVPIIEGYIFEGWYLDIDYNTEYVASTMPAYDFVLYVKLSENTALVNVLDELPEEEINVTFWHVYGDSKGALLDQFITEFESLYPNITIDAQSQGGYDDLQNKTILAITAGVTPTMLVGYPDHITGYLNGNAVIPLDDFINHETWGVDLNDFIDSYIEENNQYEDGYMYSMPYSKSSEVMIFNRTIFEANGINIPTDRPLTWAELDVYADIMVGDGPNQCEYLINYDSSANLFINSIFQWDGGYTNSDGEILIDNINTISMLEYLQDSFEDNTTALPLAWNTSYGSNNFKAQDVCMTVGSTAGINYNIPTDGSFEIGIAPVPQYDTGNMSVVQQGPNVSIMADTTDAERLAAWLFIEYITNTENTAQWAMLTGYLPVRYTSYESDLYQNFLNNPDPDYMYESMGMNAAYLQLNYMRYAPSFSKLVTSSQVRELAGISMEAIFAGYTVNEVITDMLYQLGVDYEYVDPNPDDGGPALLLPFDGFIEGGFALPESIDGAPITWTSSNPDVFNVNGDFTRPEYETGNVIFTLTATFTIDDITYTRVFTLIAKCEESFEVYTSIEEVYIDMQLGDSLAFQGVVTSVFNAGYFLSDGINALGVYNPSSELLIEVGDEVYVQGEFAVYNTLFQINNVVDEEIISTGNDVTLPVIEMTVGQLLGLPSDDMFIHGMPFTISGFVEERGDYNNLYIVDGEDAILIYYYSLEDSLIALGDLIGEKVTITVIYYTDHAINGPMVVFQGGTEDIEVITLSDVDALVEDISILSGDIPGASLSDIYLPTVGNNGTLFTDWESSNTDIYLHDGSFLGADSTTVTVTFTATATKGAETAGVSIDIVVPISKTIAEVLNMEINEFFEVTGVVYEEAFYGFFIHSDGSYIFVYDYSFLNLIEPGQEITIIGYYGEYRGMPQIYLVDYILGEVGNPLLDSIGPTSVAALENDLVPKGTIATITGTVSIEDEYDNIYITGPAGGKVVVYYRSNAGELEQFNGQIITLEVIHYQDGTVLYHGLADDVIVETGYTDLQIVEATADYINLGDIDNIESDLILPLSNVTSGAVIFWMSSNPDTVTETGVITSIIGADTYATLSATITYGAEILVIYFDITVLDANKATPSSVAEVLAMTDGESVLVVGVVTGFHYGEPMIQDPDGAAIYINDDLDVEIGDQIIIRGDLDTYVAYDTVQRTINLPILIEKVSSGNDLFAYDTYTVEEVYSQYPNTSSQRITLTDVVIAVVNDGYDSTFIDTGVTNNFSIDMIDAIKFEIPDYWDDVYEVGDVLSSITFVVLDMHYDNLRVVEVELPELTDAQNLMAAIGSLDIPETATDNLSLPIDVLEYDALIDWTSGNVAINCIPGIGEVTRPAEGEADIVVTLTATVTVGTITEVVTYTVTVLAEVPLITPPVFFSQYGDGDGGSCKFIELYNPTDAAIDLSNFKIIKGGNGTAFADSADIHLLTDIILEAGGVLVIGNPACFTGLDASFDFGFPQTGIDYIESTVVGYINGNDSLGLFYYDVLVDTIGLSGEDAIWDVGNGDLLGGTTANSGMIRVPTVVSGEADWTVAAMQWIVIDDRDYTDVGLHTCDEPTT